MTKQKFDTNRSELFSNRLVDIFNGGAIALMISIGHRTKLFDVLETLEPSTSQEIADAAGLNERYVREWLGALTVGGIIECDPDGPKFSLPAEHAAWLTRSASPNNLSVMAQYFSLMGTVEDKIIDCFHNGGGVDYKDFCRFHEIMAEDSGQSVLPELIQSILPLAPGIIEKLEEGIDVLDIGCGRGLALILMAQQFPKSNFYGYDLSEPATAYGENLAREKGLTNIQFAQKDLSNFESEQKFDLITAFDAIHDQAFPQSVLNGVKNALKEDGTFLMQDIAGSSHVHKNMDHPIGALLYTISTMHCMTVSLAQGGEGLGTMWGEELACSMLKDAGFDSVKVTRLPHDIQNAYFVAKSA